MVENFKNSAKHILCYIYILHTLSPYESDWHTRLQNLTLQLNVGLPHAQDNLDWQLHLLHSSVEHGA